MVTLAEKLKPKKTILVLGGFGYGNVGDEAQLSADLTDLKITFPDYEIKILSPNPSYTNIEHPGYQVLEAPRVAFYDEGKSKMYNIQNKNNNSLIYRFGNGVFKILFLIRAWWILFNGYLVKFGLPTFLLKVKRSSLIYEVQKSEFIFFEGGGYLTGSTLSRFWDGMYFVKLAKIFGKKVFMSGQTVGGWKTRFNKRLARRTFRSVDYISVRDPKDSLDALLDLGVSKSKVTVLCDDALFCEKTDFEKLEYELKLEKKKYIVYHLHYWGCKDAVDRKRIIDKNASLVRKLFVEYQFPIVLLSMTPSDEIALYDLLEMFNEEPINYFPHNYNYREVRSLISNSVLCITMKHHPIIFAIGEMVPVISISYTDYYRHKNEGALRLFGLEDFNISFENENMVQDLVNKSNYIFENNDLILNNLINSLNIKLKERNKFFINLQKLMKP